MAPGPRIRLKLVLLAVALIAIVLIPGGVFLERRLRDEMIRRIDRELAAHAVGAEVVIERAAAGDVPTLATMLGREAGRRVTVVAPDGTVLGDSDVAAAGLAALENHADRPEIAEARTHGRGVAQRHSDTLGTDLRYLALALPDGRIVRVAESLAEIDTALRRQRWIVALAGLIALGLTVVVSTVASHLVTGSLRELVASTRTLAGGRRATDPVGPGSRGPADELERTIKLLADERARFKAVLESMNDAVVALDPSHEITLMNPAARELLGVGDDALGHSIFEVVRVPALQDLIAADGPGSSEFELPGGARRVLAAATPERDGGGVVLVLHDVTTIRRLETVRRDFVANVSHELKTPISIVSANAETLLRGGLDDPQGAPALVEAIFRNADRLRLIIDDLLDLSRLEAGKRELQLAPVALAPAAQRAIDAVAAKASGRGTAIALAIPDDLVALADGGAIHQVLVNLLDNAIKYTPDGGHVVVRAHAKGARVRLEVTDDGPGIAPAHRERIFERFYRIDPGRARDMGGTGLGLAIVKHMLEALDGQIGVAANHPRGSIFWIELPQPHSVTNSPTRDEAVTVS